MLNNFNLAVNSASIFSKIGTEFTIGTLAKTAYGEQPFAATTLPDGGFIVAWLSNPEISTEQVYIYGQRYDENGSPIGAEFQTNRNLFGSDFASVDITSFDDGGFVIVWDRYNDVSTFDYNIDVYGQRFDANSNPISTDFRVNTTIEETQSTPSTTSLENGDFVVVWGTNSENDIYGQLYDVNGNPIDTEFKINTTTQGRPNNNAVISLNDGGFLVTWQSRQAQIYGQLYDADGNKLSTQEFLINTVTAAVNINPSATSLSSGDFVVTWVSNYQGDDDIYGQRYDIDSNLIGTEFRINTNTDGYQNKSSVTSLDDGGFVVTWLSDSQDLTTQEIYGQRYDANNNQVGSEFLVNNNTNNRPFNPSPVSLNDNSFVVSWNYFDQVLQTSFISGQIFGQVPVSLFGVFEIDKLARSGFVDGLSFNPVEIAGLPIANLYDETFYLIQNSDVAAAVNSGIVSNGYTHFVNSGQFEGRDPSILYDEDFYLEQNSDVANAVITGSFLSGFQHYVLHGQQEGRNPSTVFDEQAYRTDNPDVADVITNGGFRSGFEHYLEFGQAEGRFPFSFFYNEAYYLSQYSDVANAVALDLFTDGFEHYINFGQTEKRNPSSLFNETEYLALNTDVADAVNAGTFDSGFEHYILLGRAEGREV